MADKKELTYEEAVARLGEIVAILEKGSSALDESLRLYEEGAKLVRFCTAKLDEAEQKVVKLRKGADGEPEELPFEVKE